MVGDGMGGGLGAEGELRTSVPFDTVAVSPLTAGDDAGSGRPGGVPVGREVPVVQHPILNGLDGGRDVFADEEMWTRLAVAADEWFSLPLSGEGYQALCRIESAARRAAGLPPLQRQRLRLA